MATTPQNIALIEHGKYDDVFSKLYGSSKEMIRAQRERYIAALQDFASLYGEEREITIYSAPGRTEIGGNHTDHNNGIVFAAAVNLDIIAVVAKTQNNRIHVTSKGFALPDDINLAILEPQQKETGHSASLIRGVAVAIKNRGGVIGGFDAYTTSDVLRGSGLSSSAAFEVCMATILNGEYNENRFTPVEIGIISQFAENVFFGKPSGLMDQTASSVGGAITIDFKNPEKPIVSEISFDLEKQGHHLVITDTKGSHAHLTDEYAAIRQEMEAVAAHFGKKVLREVAPEDFYKQISALRSITGDRAILRAHHFYEECRRAMALADYVREENFAAFLSTLSESGHSSFEFNQNAYSVTHPLEQGISLGLALSQKALGQRGACRLQGGGFAGTIQAFVPDDLLGKYCQCLQSVFGEDACYVLSIRAKGGTKVL